MLIVRGERLNRFLKMQVIIDIDLCGRDVQCACIGLGCVVR